ncbi:MAG TPA: hypothetical protein VFS62_14550 [Chloroflexota bacterium]|nr:hypothetical protein [Chloroflexota bacterium]
MAAELVRKAVEYLSAHGPTPPAELAAHVLGGAGLAPLLASLADERLQFDGACWSLTKASDEVAILEVLATGPNPRRHRVVEVAALRGGRRLALAIRSARAVPRLLRQLGVRESGEDAVELDEAARQLRDFLAGATIAGFSVVPSFVEQLLGPVWPAIDLLRLLFASAEYAGRPDPARVARHFGLTPPAGTRPEAMVGFSAALLQRLRGERSVDELLALGKPLAMSPPPPRAPAGQPGVYVMSSWEGEPLYVGKSVDVARRASSYLHTPIDASRGLHHLMQLTARIDVIAVDSELEALLLESQLIRDWLPSFNVVRGQRPRARYLRLSCEPFPRLTLAVEPAEDRATYFGPFRHATAAARLREVLTDVLRLRTCTRRLPPARRPAPACGKAAAGTCLAPCIVGPPPSPYREEVEVARRLLSGSAEEFRTLLRQLLRQRPPSAATAPRLRRRLEALKAG